MFRYDANAGDYPKLGDYVQVVRSGEANDGLKGRIGGWGDLDMYVALIALDKPLDDGRTIVGWPVVCLQKAVTEHFNKFQKAFEMVSADDGFEIIEPFSDPDFPSLNPTVDKDGYTIWNGGAKRPVPDDTIIAVKVRGEIPRGPVDAQYWPQICWMHHDKDDPMNKWDIIAYKVVENV